MALELKTKQDVMHLLFNSVRFRMQYPTWVTIRAAQICNEVIIDELHKRMRDFNYSEKIIETTYLSDFRIDDGFIVFDVISDYRAETGYDVALGREKGTRRHFVAPVIKFALSWIINGIRAFSKGHWVKGITATNVIDKTVDELLPVVQARLDDETDDLFTRSMTG